MSPLLASSLLLGTVFAVSGLLYARGSRAGGPALPG